MTILSLYFLTIYVKLMTVRNPYKADTGEQLLSCQFKHIQTVSVQLIVNVPTLMTLLTIILSSLYLEIKFDVSRTQVNLPFYQRYKT